MQSYLQLASYPQRAPVNNGGIPTTFPNWNRRRFRCCFGCMHIKTGAFVIGIVDLFCISTAFGRGIYLYYNLKDNPMAASWFVVSSLMVVLGAFAILAMFYGIWRERYLWLLPKLVLTIFSVALLSVSTIGLVYLVFEHSQFVVELIAERVVPSSDYENARFAVKIGGTALVVICLILAVVETWFCTILYKCFLFFKRKYFWTKIQERYSKGNCNVGNRRASNDPVVVNCVEATVPSSYEFGNKPNGRYLTVPPINMFQRYDSNV